MSQEPFGIVFYLIVTLWLGNLWLRDIRAAAKDPEVAGTGFPGATTCTLKPIAVAVAGTLVLLAAETFGEIQLGISEEQSDVSWFFLLALISGAIVEEFVFRGYLVIESRGHAAKWISIFAFSAIFALIHPYVWSFDLAEETADAGMLSRLFDAFSLNFTTKAIFSTAFIFVGSLWFYFVRFFRLNPQHSIIVPIAAHVAKNVAVFAIKLAQGHVTSLI